MILKLSLQAKVGKQDSSWLHIRCAVLRCFCFAEELTLKPITNWVIADLVNNEGRALVKAALQQMVCECSSS